MPKMKTTKQFCKEVNDLVDNEYTVIGEYCGANKHISIKHNNCGNIYNVTPSNFLQGCRCPKCFGINTRTNEQFLCEVQRIYGDSISILSDYKGNKIYVSCKCNNCGTEWLSFPQNLLRGHSCSVCAKDKLRFLFSKSEFDFQNELKSIHLGKITALDKYNGNARKIRFRCTVCDNVWEATPNKILNSKQGCPSCSASHGEREIEKFLKDNNINYETQKEFNGLNGNYLPLRYDFYLPNNNILIEYQGEYHDGNVRNQTKEELLLRKDYDNRKRKYAENNGIKLVEIWYFDFNNIQTILSELLIVN